MVTCEAVSSATTNGRMHRSARRGLKSLCQGRYGTAAASRRRRDRRPPADECWTDNAQSSVAINMQTVRSASSRDAGAIRTAGGVSRRRIDTDGHGDVAPLAGQHFCRRLPQVLRIFTARSGRIISSRACLATSGITQLPEQFERIRSCPAQSASLPSVPLRDSKLCVRPSCSPSVDGRRC